MLGYETVQIYILLCLNDKINDKLMTLQVHSHLIMLNLTIIKYK
jgi:hypothetical protein